MPYKIKMQKQLSTKYRLVTLLLISILPGSHRLYVGRIKTGLCMLLGIAIAFAPAIIFSDSFSLHMSEINKMILMGIIASLPLASLVWMLIDFSKISVGLFTDSNNLFLLRRKGYEISQKSNITAILLCTFLGFLGIHRFYLGKIKSAGIILCGFLLTTITLIYYIFTEVYYHHASLLDLFNNFITLSTTNYFTNNLSLSSIKTYVLICIFWVYTIDMLALLGGVLTDANNKLPKDFSS